MMEVFNGLKRAYGTYSMDTTETKLTPGGNKTTGTPATVQGVVDEDLWERHLVGIEGLGIVPIRDDSTCFFGAIDIDVYKSQDDMQKVIEQIYGEGLPMIPCRTKSGGLHCYCFIKEPVTAKELRAKLESFAAAIGYGNAEIFPKQNEIISDRGDIGSWINIPYYNYKDTNRYAYKKDGTAMTIEEFLKAVYKIRLSLPEFKAYTISLLNDIDDGPPCLQILTSRGFQSGTRNAGMYNLVTYYKKAFPDTWEGMVDEANIKYCDPQLSSRDVQTIINSQRKKSVNYQCQISPLKDCCNSTLCRTKRYGVGEMLEMPQLTGLTKYDTDPPIWFIDVEGGGRLELTTEDLQSQQRFQRKCIETLNTFPPKISQPMWQAMVSSLLDKVIILEAPKEASSKGLLLQYLEMLCTDRAVAKEEEEILRGLPWTDKGRHYFRLLDFRNFLERRNFKEFKINKVAAILKDEVGGTVKYRKISGKGINVWSIKQFAPQTEDFKAAKIEDKEVF